MLGLKLTGAAAVLAMLATPTAARAANMTFDQVENGGTVVQSGGDYVGEDIIFEYITYLGQSAFCGPVASIEDGSDVNCLLDFDTGDGSFTLTAPEGLYDEFGNLLPGLDGSSVTVMTGTITDFEPVDFGDGLVAIFISGSDTKLQELLDFFGINATDQDAFQFDNSEIDITSEGLVQEADLTNDVTPFETPEPGLLTLFGLGLLGVGRRFARNRR